MKRILLIFFIFILLLLFLVYHNSSPKVIISELMKKYDIKPGNLKYRIYLFGILPAGEAVFESGKIEEYNGKKVYHLRATAQNLKFFSKFFNGFVVLDSYVETEKFSPLLFKQKLAISGKPDMDREAIYDQGQGIMSIKGVRRQIFPNTQDPLSLMFKLRHMDFAKQKGFEFNINTNQKNYIFKGVAQARDITVNNTIYKVVFLKALIRRRDNNPYHRSDVNIIMLRHNENIPILIKVFSGGHLVNIRLAGIE